MITVLCSDFELKELKILVRELNFPLPNGRNIVKVERLKDEIRIKTTRLLKKVIGVKSKTNSWTSSETNARVRYVY